LKVKRDRACPPVGCKAQFRNEEAAGILQRTLRGKAAGTLGVDVNRIEKRVWSDTLERRLAEIQLEYRRNAACRHFCGAQSHLLKNESGIEEWQD